MACHRCDGSENGVRGQARPAARVGFCGSLTASSTRVGLGPRTGERRVGLGPDCFWPSPCASFPVAYSAASSDQACE